MTEQCDNGSANGSNSTCSMSCERNIPMCNTFNYTVYNPASTGLYAECSGSVVVADAPVDGLCNMATENTIYYTGTAPTALCSSGTATGLSYNNTTHIWTWSCEGLNGGTTDSCMASGSYCGDGIIGTGE